MTDRGWAQGSPAPPSSHNLSAQLLVTTCFLCFLAFPSWAGVSCPLTLSCLWGTPAGLPGLMDPGREPKRVPSAGCPWAHTQTRCPRSLLGLGTRDRPDVFKPMRLCISVLFLGLLLGSTEYMPLAQSSHGCPVPKPCSGTREGHGTHPDDSAFLKFSHMELFC